MSIQTFADATRAARKDRAAVMVAEDELPDREIASRLGVSRAAVTAWRRDARFMARVEALQEAARARLERGHIAGRQYRLDELTDKYKRMQQVILERAADPSMAAVPGGTSGLLVKTIKVIGQGKYAQTMEEYAVDVGLLREMRETMKQAAIERGEWSEKQETQSKGELTIRVEYVDRPIGPGLAALNALEAGEID